MRGVALSQATNYSLKRISYAAVLMFAAAYVWIALRGPRGVPALLEKRREIQVLQEQNANLVQQLEARKERIRKLEHDRSEQDRVIRERLKLQRPGETTFKLPDPPQSSAPAAP
jgi:cell division protein FtsB